MWNWNSKLHNRPWVRTITGGVTQIYTRIAGTTVVIPATPRTITLLASQAVTQSYVASRSTVVSLIGSL